MSPIFLNSSKWVFFHFSHAVDWIQDEGLVRVLVGKGGTVMFTLKMPPDYLISGDITVVNASGLPSNMSLADSMVCLYKLSRS